MSEFTQPLSNGEFIKSAEIKGKLILVLKVHEKTMRFDSLANAERPLVRCDLVILDGDGVLRERVALTQQYVCDRLDEGMAKVLGRVTQLPGKKQGQQGAIILDAYTDADAEIARQWLAAREAGGGSGDAELDEAARLLEAGLA